LRASRPRSGGEARRSGCPDRSTRWPSAVCARGAGAAAGQSSGSAALGGWRVESDLAAPPTRVRAAGFPDAASRLSGVARAAAGGHARYTETPDAPAVAAGLAGSTLPGPPTRLRSRSRRDGSGRDAAPDGMLGAPTLTARGLSRRPGVGDESAAPPAERRNPMKPSVATSAAFAPPRGDQRQHTLRVLLLDGCRGGNASDWAASAWTSSVPGARRRGLETLAPQSAAPLRQLPNGRARLRAVCRDREVATSVDGRDDVGGLGAPAAAPSRPPARRAGRGVRPATPS
jgi:hypothetical protein